MWFGFAIAFALAALMWLASHLRSVRSDGTVFEDPWFTSAASTGSGSNGEDPDRPRVVTIKHLAARRDKILKWLRRMDVPESEVEDVAQKITHSAWKTSTGYDCTRSKLDTWLFKVTFYHASGYHESAWAQHYEAVDPAFGPWHELIAEDNPEDKAAEAEVRDQAFDLLDRLPVHQAVAVFISDYHGEDAPTIAKAWGKNTSTVYSWIKQGRAALARELAAEAVRATTQARKKRT